MAELTGNLLGHTAAINGVTWAPHTQNHVCTVADDRQVLIWDVNSKSRPVEEPILQYVAHSEINNVEWNGVHKDWVGICFDSYVQILRI